MPSLNRPHTWGGHRANASWRVVKKSRKGCCWCLNPPPSFLNWTTRLKVGDLHGKEIPLDPSLAMTLSYWQGRRKCWVQKYDWCKIPPNIHNHLERVFTVYYWVKVRRFLTKKYFYLLIRCPYWQIATSLALLLDQLCLT